jgi:hypothetical protein
VEEALHTETTDHTIVQPKGLIVDLAILTLGKVVNDDTLVDLGLSVARLTFERVLSALKFLSVHDSQLKTSCEDEDQTF